METHDYEQAAKAARLRRIAAEHEQIAEHWATRGHLGYAADHREAAIEEREVAEAGGRLAATRVERQARPIATAAALITKRRSEDVPPDTVARSCRLCRSISWPRPAGDGMNQLQRQAWQLLGPGLSTRPWNRETRFAPQVGR
jgi:hypothetical protein